MGGKKTGSCLVHLSELPVLAVFVLQLNKIQNIHASAMIFDSRNITEFCLVECNDYPSMDADHFYIFCKFISAFLIAYVCTFCEFSFRLVVTSYRFLH